MSAAASDAPVDRLAVALLRKIEAVLGLGHLPATAVDELVFEGAEAALGGRPLTSIDVITVLVAVQEEIGVSLLNRSISLRQARSGALLRWPLRRRINRRSSVSARRGRLLANSLLETRSDRPGNLVEEATEVTDDALVKGEEHLPHVALLIFSLNLRRILRGVVAERRQWQEPVEAAGRHQLKLGCSRQSGSGPASEFRDRTSVALRRSNWRRSN